MTQDDKKRIAAEKAIEFIPQDAYIGVGTGSTVNHFIRALAKVKNQIKGAVSTSLESTRLLEEIGIEVVTLSEVPSLPVYIDGADEVNHSLQMIKGGGGALLAEKVVAEASERFICIVDDSKYVQRLGEFPLPVEIAPIARTPVAHALVKMGGEPALRLNFITANGNEILDVSDINLNQPLTMENAINSIPGVMENGLFARRPADILIIGRDDGPEIITVSATADL